MHQIPNRAKPNSGNDSKGEREAGGENNSELFNTVKTANSKIKLYQVLKGLHIIPQRYSNDVEWSNTISCPFPDHKDRNASFGYNFKTDRFHCFGCNKSGRAVEFLANYQQVSLSLSAQKIIELYGKSNNEEIDEEDKDSKKVYGILIEAANYFNHLVQKHKNNPIVLKSLDRFFWMIDVYLMTKFDYNGLKFRIDRAREIINVISNSW